MKRLLVLNGPNLNLLGMREPDVYGRETYSDLLLRIERAARTCGCSCTCVQSNHEGVLVDEIQKAWGRFDGIVLNPAAYTHTSIAILDALKAVGLPAVEVHISDPEKREAYRHRSFVKEACIETIAGQGLAGYDLAIARLCAHLDALQPEQAAKSADIV